MERQGFVEHKYGRSSDMVFLKSNKHIDHVGLVESGFGFN